MKNKILLKSSLLARTAFFTLMLLSTTTLLNAQTITFGQFFEVNGTNDFIFTNNTSTATFNTIAGGSPVTFTYQNVSGLPPELQGPQAAHVFVTAVTTTPATVNGNRVNQPFDQTFTIQIIRDSPASTGTGSRTNLLTAVVTPVGSSFSDLAGDIGSSSVAYTASTPNQALAYSSDFIGFGAPIVERNLALSFSSVTPALSIGPSGFLNSFSAAGTGTFAANPGPVFIPITAASVTISGQVFSLKGTGLEGARVSLTNSEGVTVTTRTDSSGYYRFNDIEIGQAVVISVTSKRNTFAPRAVNVGEELVGMDFFPQ